MQKKVIYYATGNSGKFATIKQIFQDYPQFELRQLDVDLSEEQTNDQQAIAIAKAKLAWNIIQQPVLVDDGGIYFHRYYKFPGTLTKFVYQGLGLEGIYRLYDEGDKASFIVTLVYCTGPEEYRVFTHETKGHLVKPREGKPDEKLPFEFILVPHGYTQTFQALKHTPAFAHFNPRVLVVKQFIDFYENNSL